MDLDLLLIAHICFVVDDLAQSDLIIMSIVAILLTFLFGYYTSEGRVLSIDSVGPWGPDQTQDMLAKAK